MQVIEALDRQALGDTPRAVCVGAFDGLHLGHQFLLSRLCGLAYERDLCSTMVTFEPIPAQFFAPPDAEPMRLTTRSERIELSASLCCDAMVLLAFNRELARLTAEEFCRSILVDQLHTRLLFASHTHTLGSDHADLARLSALGQKLGFEVQTAPVLQCDDQWLSSTAIRDLLRTGHVEETAGLLGRHYSLQGTVTSGRGLGRQLGFPTANLSVPPEKRLPADAVYAGLARLGRAPAYPAAISIGRAPTFDLTERLIEAHLITDEPLELVGETLTLEFVRRLRLQQKFASVEALQEQIARDVDQTLKLCASLQERNGPTCQSLS